VIQKLHNGELIDLEMFKRGEDDDSSSGDQISLYRRFLLNKYPHMTFKNYQTLSQNLENLKNNLVPALALKKA
jgi:hypothetical protein